MSFFSRLHIYTVHCPPDTDALDDVKLVREGFNLYAFLFTTLWALYHRLWKPFFGLLLVSAAFYFLEEQKWLSHAALLLMQLGVQVMVGYLANDWLREKLAKRGYLLSDIASGENESRAGQRFFDRALTSCSA